MRLDKITSVSEKIIYVLLCILMVDCCIFGAGRVILLGGISFRMFLIGLLCFAAIPICIIKIKEILKSKYFVSLVVFGVWVIVALVRGLMAGNRLALILSDIKGFMYFIVFPIMLVVLKNKDQIRKLMKYAMYATTLLGIYSICMIAVYNLLPDLFDAVFQFGIQRNFSRFSPITTSIIRLFFNSSMYAVCGCAFSVYFQIVECKKFNLKYSVISALNLVAILLTYTRSIYLGTGVAALVLVGLLFVLGQSKERIRLTQHLILAASIFAGVMLTINVCTRSEYFQYAFERTFGSAFGSSIDTEVDDNVGNDNASDSDTASDVAGDITGSTELGEDTSHYQELTMISDELRGNTLAELFEKIKVSPIIGKGLGTELECRPSGFNEYFFLDLWAKCGLIGVLLYVMPIIFMCIEILRKIIQKDKDVFLFVSWLAVLLGFCTFSYFNPYMNAALGITYYSFCMTIFNNEKLLADKNY